MFEGLGAVGGGDVGGVEEIFCAPGDAVEWAAVVAGGDFGVGGIGLREGVVAGEGDDAVDPGIEALDAFEVDLGEAGAGEFAGLDPAGEMVDGSEGDGFVGGGEWRVGFGAEELVFGGTGGGAGEDGVDGGVGDGCGGYDDFAGAGAAFVEGGHGAAPIAGGLSAVFFGELVLDEFFGFGEGGGGDLGADGG